MSKTARISVITVLLIASVAIAATVVLNKSSAVETTTRSAEGITLPIVKQDVTSREWRELDADTLAILGLSDEHLLYRPLSVVGDSRGNSYVIDYGDFIIKKFDVKGNFINAYGNGRGEGPGEFLNPTDIHLDGEGILWVADGAARTLTKFSEGGEVLTAIKIEEGIHRVATTADGRYYIMRVGPNSELFHLYDSSDQLLHSFGSVIEDQANTFMAIDGWITTVDNDLIYSPFFYGFIARFNERGEVVFARETLDQRESPTVETIYRGNSKAQRLSSRVFLKVSLSYSEGKIYVYALTASKQLEATVIDVFDADDGKYLYSFKVPGVAGFGHVKSNYLYTVQDTTGIVYQLR